MITKSNLTEVLNGLSQDEILKVYESDKDYIKLELHIFNVGGYGTLEAVDYDEEEEEEVQSNGNLYTDKENFSVLVKESETTNKTLIEFFT